jgi:hypothetical protein
VGGAEPDELAAGIWKLLQRPELNLLYSRLPELGLLDLRVLQFGLLNLGLWDLSLRRTRHNEARDNR